MNLKSVVVVVVVLDRVKNRIVEDDIQQKLMYIHWQVMLLRDRYLHFQNLQMNYNRDQHESGQIGIIADEIFSDDFMYMIIEMVDFVVDRYENNVYATNHVDFQ